MSRTKMATLAWMLSLAILAGCSGADNEERGSSPSPSASPTETIEPSLAPTEKPGASEEPAQSDDGESYAVLAEKLRIPWSIAIYGSEFIVTEREGNIVVIADGQQKRQNVRLEKAVLHRGEGGMLGLLLAPDFDQSQLAYVYHTYEEGGKALNRIVQLKREGAEWSEQKALLEGIPGSANHNGGRLAIGPDGMLYATTGDAENRSEAQNRDSLAGKILRMTLDGDIPTDNPFTNSYVYSFGHRNPQGLAWTKDGSMYSTEHGPSGNPGGHDEINVIQPGANYGWPTVYGDDKKEGLTPPVYHTGDPAVAPSGTVIDDEGRLVIATLRGEAIYRYTPSSGEMEIIHKDEGRIRDVKLVGNKLYFITNNTDGRGGISSEAEDRLVVMDYPA
ncbi:PQQ-dependent sugar dehydrogenase [Paenibacillus sp. PAMC21692]|nr:PQQ-dependent sugar dehydrogenase [Paenibacillus sp. PAMC21692]